MANEEHLNLLKQGVVAWNEWRQKNPELIPDLSMANLRMAGLNKADLSGAYLRKADLSQASLHKANLSEATLYKVNLSKAYLREANLGGANLIEAQLIGTDICNAKLTGSWIYGISAWDVRLDAATRQENLRITLPGEPVITVDNIKVAQFIYLLLNNEEIRDVIDTITSKAVLILGRFSEERKLVLDALREELRKHNYLPIMFDFDATANQTIIETVKTLAGMSRFVIADLTDARVCLRSFRLLIRTVERLGSRTLKNPLSNYFFLPRQNGL